MAANPVNGVLCLESLLIYRMAALTVETPTAITYISDNNRDLIG